MARRIGQQISVLKKSVWITFLLIFFAAEALSFIAISLLFQKLEGDRSRAITSVIGSMLRNESLLSQSYMLAQSIEDLHAHGVLHCAKLIHIKENENAVFFDSTYRSSCPASQFERMTFLGLDGHSWQFAMAPVVHPSFYVTKWTTLALTVFLVAGIFFLILNIIRGERKKRESIESKRLFLEELTNQVRHDVASPVSALKMIAARAPPRSGHQVVPSRSSRPDGRNF